METRWKAMRFECPNKDCHNALTIADHSRRDPETVMAGTCAQHGEVFRFDRSWPLYEADEAVKLVNDAFTGADSAA